MNQKHRIDVRLAGGQTITIKRPEAPRQVVSAGRQGPAGTLSVHDLARVNAAVAQSAEASREARAANRAVTDLVAELTNVFDHTTGKTEAMT
ncbi:hypothetical protein ACUN9V_05080 [Salinicola sp. V024]|uniref:hypothetical protein n=1 Tax=Salinicola sp. V024 TaxID=3459609 RepID=UPI0040450B73